MDYEDIAEFENFKEISVNVQVKKDEHQFYNMQLTDVMWDIGRQGHLGVKKTWLHLKQCGF